MELFTTAGIELPKTDRKGRGPRLARRLHAPLFNYKVVQEAIGRANLFDLTDAKRALAADYARKIRDPAFLKQKEVAVRGRLVEEVFQGVLGYRPYDPTGFDLAIERPIRGGAVDVALGRFSTPYDVDEIIAPFELKGPDTTDLDRIMPGRGRSPVQQAWDYAIDAPGSRWVLVSNCLEVRLYAFGRGRDAYERFDLARLDDPLELERLWMILSAAHLLGDAADKLLLDTDTKYRDVTNDLYKQYRTLRGNLIDHLRAAPEGGAALAPLVAIEVAQKLLDRVLFIAFAQRTDLMRDKLLEEAAKPPDPLAPQRIWVRFQNLFKAVDQGLPTLDIPPYNGGLFAHDPVADGVLLPDHLAQEMARLGEWDYRSEVPVTVLGHLFEQSITDLEALKDGQAPAVSKKKREGVVYTPDMITRFLVERTVALSLDERRAALWAEHGMAQAEISPEAQVGFWRAYLAALRDFTIVDPACGSGAFLVAAFDEMARRYRDVVTALEGLEQEIDFDAFDEIVSNNLYGVDLNAESVEITRLSLWLKTARRDHKLQNLIATIKDGDSLIADPAHSRRPFDWAAKFPGVFARGGFDVVIGNPPYVRMEHLKAIKPYLAQHYIVADERTDLSAYFFEKGVSVLKPGGRLGYISSSTFFRAGFGENLRTFLSDGVAIEAVVDFGDTQVFEGVTTYPAILTLRKGVEDAGGDLTFLGVKGAVPGDLGRPFLNDGAAMPRARLGKGSWQFEDADLATLRAKITVGRKTLGEVYGRTSWGMKTGFNKAFVIDRVTRDALVKMHTSSEELIKPYVRGDDIKRWRVNDGGAFLINTPKGQVEIDRYPAIRDWLTPFKDDLENRATQQEWWELQQAQVAYQQQFLAGGVVFPDISQGPKFAALAPGHLIDGTCFCWSGADAALLGYLNSRAFWFVLFAMSNPLRGAMWRLRLKAQYVEAAPAPDFDASNRAKLAQLANAAGAAASERAAVETTVRRRILDLAPPARRKLNGKLEAWHALDFAGFRAEVKKTFGIDMSLRERDDWEPYLAENRAEVNALTARIEAAEREIDAIVYRLFDLTPAETTLLETSLAGQY